VTKKKTPDSVWIAAIVAVLLLVAVAGYFAVVSPQRGRAADLSTQVDDTERQITEARALVAKAKNAQTVKVADVFKLTKAMPDSPDEAGVLLDLNNVAERSGIKFDSLNVDASTTVSSYQVIPLRVAFRGNFYALSDFLFRLRNLVDVRRGALDSTGRLFAVDKVSLDEGGLDSFPMIQAQITINAFVYGTGSPADVAPAQSTSAPGSGSTTTPAATTTTTSTTATTPTTPAAPAASATAAGATP
jgi:type IV pilus assembly PilO-like protein